MEEKSNSDKLFFQMKSEETLASKLRKCLKEPRQKRERERRGEIKPSAELRGN